MKPTNHWFQMESFIVSCVLWVYVKWQTRCTRPWSDFADADDALFLSCRVGGASWPAAVLVSEADSWLQSSWRHQPHIFLEEWPGPLRSHTPPEAGAHVMTHTKCGNADSYPGLDVCLFFGLWRVICPDWPSLNWAGLKITFLLKLCANSQLTARKYWLLSLLRFYLIRKSNWDQDAFAREHWAQFT